MYASIENNYGKVNHWKQGIMEELEHQQAGEEPLPYSVSNIREGSHVFSMGVKC